MYIDTGPLMSPAPTIDINIYDTRISHGRSVMSGGGVYAGGANTAVLRLNKCDVITFFETEGSGGFFFIATPTITLEKLEGTNFNHLAAVKGGYIEGSTNPTKITVSPTF
jgi:hypothetical protein